MPWSQKFQEFPAPSSRAWPNAIQPRFSTSEVILQTSTATRLCDGRTPASRLSERIYRPPSGRSTEWNIGHRTGPRVHLRQRESATRYTFFTSDADGASDINVVTASDIHTFGELASPYVFALSNEC